MITSSRFVCAQCRIWLTRPTPKISIQTRLRIPIARARLYATRPQKHVISQPRPVASHGAKVRPFKPRDPALKPKITPAFPASLRIYAPTMARIGGVAVLKTTFIFMFLGTCLFAVPYAWRVQTMTEKRNWLQLGAIYILGATPALVYSVISAPFVASISLRLPKRARVSKEKVYQYITSLPGDTHITIQTMRILPLQKTKDVRLRDLRFMKGKRWGLANLEIFRGAQFSKGGESWKEKWRSWTPLFRQQFHVDPKFDEFKAAVEDRIPLPGIWEAVKVHIKRNNQSAKR